jgi:hypothetical protein
MTPAGTRPDLGLSSAVMPDSELDRLAAAKYLLVSTYRRTGVAVPTPVWHARDGDRLVVWTVTGSGKVKRLRNNPAVRLAPCTVRGRPTGPAVDGTGEILDAAGTDRARRLIAARYGVLGRVSMRLSLWRRGRDGTIALALHPTAPAAPAAPADPA